MRDSIIHDYPVIDNDVMWDTLVTDLPQLAEAVGAYLRSSSSKG